MVYIDEMFAFIAKPTESQDMKVFNVEFRHQCAVFIAFVITWCGSVAPVVTNNFVDSVPVFSAKGTSISLLSKKIGEESSKFSFSVSPYTQIIRTCYDSLGAELGRLGDRMGYWGMGAMASGVISNYDPNTNPSSWTSVIGDVATFPQFWKAAKDNAATIKALNFNSSASLFYSVDFEYEKIGIRSEAAFEPAEGIVCSLQGGVCDHKTSAPQYWNPTTGAAYVETGSNDATIAAFMFVDKREIYLDEFGLDASGYQNIELDDFTAQIAVYCPMPFSDHAQPVVRLVPRATMALIVPSDEIFKKKASTILKDNVMQSLVPVGNDGFTGFMVEGALGLDFQDTINLTIAAGYTIFKERSIKDYRVPNNKYQCVLYPFKQNISKKRGATWHLSTSMYAEDFIPGMKCFMEYSWVVHRRDTITLDTAANLPIFKDGLETLSRLSEFRVGTGHLGMSYKMSKDLEAGVSLQVVLHGTQVFKPYTFMGSLFIVF